MAEEEFAFDTGKVKSLESNLNKAKNDVDKALKEIEIRVKNIKQWWYGPAAVDAFVSTFIKSKDSVSAAIDEWLKKEKACIAEAQQIMDSLDKSLKIESQAAKDPISGAQI